MIDKILDVILDAVIDSAKVLPFLFAVYLLIEYIEHRSSDKLGKALQKMGPFGAVGGSILGAIPQCGFSVVASNLYTGRLISMGTLIAVYLSTSDEAIPLLISNPEFADKLWKLILIKTLAGIAAGIIVDVVLRIAGRNQSEEPFKELCDDCDCEHHSILHSALHHTLHIIIFILVVNLILGFVMEFAGIDAVKTIMMSDSAFQPFIAAIVGFIPNCAASVVLTQLYMQDIVSFGALISGLCTGAGMGLLVLFKINKHYRENFLIMGILYISAVATGFITNIIF
ncbi:putative manganese transporter [uncultured Ruminococcus sp.]|uniref:putative manganese transporter n=1 Tax=uncultured Ruminococcus sp. TaxID=165186 RepID=UPI0025D43EAD|nr:putative manganese transporter [uncultured Ruminococcus sp.]